MDIAYISEIDFAFFPRSFLVERVAAKSSFYNIDRINELKIELVRKSIHMAISLVPILAAIDKGFTFALLAGGIVVYTYSEILRSEGRSIAVIAGIKELALRERDRDRFAMGPVTLAMGAMAALFFYPQPAAAVAVYALAFGDGFASLAGKFAGRRKIPFTGGKTYVGSLACFTAVFFSAYRITGSIVHSILIASIATLTEILPLGDFDNLLLPIVTGYTATVLMY